MLPQGEFAEFLHAEPRKRQEKLVRLLGLDVYERIAKEANGESAAQRQRAKVLTEQLGSYADATAEAEEAAAARVAELATLTDRVAVAVPELSAAAVEQRTAREHVARMHDERARLAAVRAPEGLSELGARRAAARAAATAAAAAAAQAEEADNSARAALAAEPARSRLEQLLRDHRELAAADAELPGMQDQLVKATAEYEVATRDAADALVAQEAARAAVETAVAAHRTADERAQRLRAERTALRTLAAPSGLDALRGRSRGTARAGTGPAESVAAERAETQARAAAEAVLPRAVLTRARCELTELAAAEQAHATAVTGVEAARRALTEAAETAAAARHRRDHARTAHTAAVRSGLAATLRATLVAGRSARSAPTPSRRSPRTPAHPRPTPSRSSTMRSRPSSGPPPPRRARPPHTSGRRPRWRGRTPPHPGCGPAWPTPPSPTTPRSPPPSPRWSGSRRSCSAPPRRYEPHAPPSPLPRRRWRTCGPSPGGRPPRWAARDPLVPFGAPGIGDDPFAGWAALLEWAATEAAEREAELPAATSAAGTAEQERYTTEGALRAAERAARDRRAAETAAARAEQEARAAVTAIERRAAALRTAVDGAPPPAAAEAALVRVAAAERAAEAADAALRAARREQRVADTAAADVDRAVAAGWRVLRAARDPLVALGAPVLDGSADGAAAAELPEAWAALLAWADTAREERATQVAAAEQAATVAAERVDELAERLAAELAGPPARRGPCAEGQSQIAVRAQPTGH